jgi:hypothetical protein
MYDKIIHNTHINNIEPIRDITSFVEDPKNITYAEIKKSIKVPTDVSFLIYEEATEFDYYDQSILPKLVQKANKLSKENEILFNEIKLQYHLSNLYSYVLESDIEMPKEETTSVDLIENLDVHESILFHMKSYIHCYITKMRLSCTSTNNIYAKNVELIYDFFMDKVAPLFDTQKPEMPTGHVAKVHVLDPDQIRVEIQNMLLKFT